MTKTPIVQTFKQLLYLTLKITTDCIKNFIKQ